MSGRSGPGGRTCTVWPRSTRVSRSTVHCLTASSTSTGVPGAIHGLIAYPIAKYSGGHMRYVRFRGLRSTTVTITNGK